ncbi:MAG: biotin/lipoyl-containing protein [Bryobacteraceae bacterium]
MKVSVAVNGTVREVDLDHLGADIKEAEPGVYSVLVDGRSYEARIEQSNGHTVVFIDGHRFETEVKDPRRRSRKGGASGIEGRVNVAAPMPGKIVRLLVAVGDDVSAGQGLLVVEAMKMQNEMKSPKAGRVVALPAAEGATVTAGEVLASIE